MTTKTILFASLIVAMILPFSGMQSVNATENEEVSTKYYEHLQENIFDRIDFIEGKIDTVTNDAVKERFEATIQSHLAASIERAYDLFGAEELLGPFEITREAYPSDGEYTEFNLSGTILGCDGVLQSWSYRGVMFNGETWVLIDQNLIPTVNIATANGCGEKVLQDSIRLQLQPVFSDVGCEGDITTGPTGFYAVECGTEISGLWIVELSFTYDRYDVRTFYTYLYV